MSVIVAEALAGDDEAAEPPGTGADQQLLVDVLVARLHTEFGVDRDELRYQVEAALAAFASARVKVFVPILVEKRMREAYRGRRAADLGR